MKNSPMRWGTVLALVVLFVAVTLLAGAGAANAAAERIPIENININCQIVSERKWVEDGILHIRDRVMTGVVDSTSATHRGTQTMVMNANVDMATGYGNYWGKMTIYPYDYPGGYWEGNTSLQVNAGHSGGIARLKGFGDLEGMATKTAVYPANPANYMAYCGGNLPISAATVEGYVLITGGK